MSAPLVLGTAGHIDHGKTALVKALSGVDCDRLPEERERGITIELGFAPLVLPSGRRLSVVDVPGHEKLVRTMVSGATGMDLVLFVVAADEGMMPQTREHLAICELLGVRRGVVALTKMDAVEPDLAELARLEIEEELAASALGTATIVPVSALRGDGLEALLAELSGLAEGALSTSAPGQPAWLPVDRVFTMKGFGTVVTGTLRGAPLEAGAQVEILAEGTRELRSARVRGLQVHGQAAPQVDPGSRCAVNLQGVDLASVPRGSVVASPGRLDWRPRVGAEITLLPDAPVLRSNTSWTFHVGTSERLARVILLDEREGLRGGESALVELRFDRPVIALEHDRFILRGFSRLPGAGWTIGGGRVLDAAPLRGRRPRPLRHAELAAIAAGASVDAIRVRLERSGARGVLRSQLARELLSLDALEGLVGAGDALLVGAERVLAREPFDALVDALPRTLAAHHEQVPTDAWVGLAGVASRLETPPPEDVLRAALDAAARSGTLESSGSGFRSPGHVPHAGDPELADTLADELEGQALRAETLPTLARALGRSLEELRRVAEHGVREGRLARIASDHYLDRKALDALEVRLRAHLEEHGQIDPTAYKQLTGQSRKYTVPLMEYFDGRRVTVRRGNLRLLR